MPRLLIEGGSNVLQIWRAGLISFLLSALALLALLSPLAPLLSSEAHGQPWLQGLQVPLEASPSVVDCDRLSHLVKKYGRHGVITRLSLFEEVGIPAYSGKLDYGEFFCWLCSKRCPAGQKKEGNEGCIGLDSDWRVTGYSIPVCKRVPRESESVREKAEKGDAEAQFNLGQIYYEGKGVPQDDSEAAKWYRKAAEKSHRVAQYNLGKCYQMGNGVNKSDAKARKWFSKAADQGDEDAKKQLAKTQPETDIWSSLKGAWEKYTQKDKDQSKEKKPPAPDHKYDRKRPANTSGDVCESAEMLLSRLADGIAQDDRGGRIDMGNTKEVTDGQTISMKWREDMWKNAKVLHNEHEKKKINPLSESIFQAEQAVRQYIKTRRDNERRKDNDCSALNTTLDKFKREIARIQELCPSTNIPSEMTHPMKKCLPKATPQPRGRDTGWDAYNKCHEQCKERGSVCFDEALNRLDNEAVKRCDSARDECYSGCEKYKPR